MSETVMERDNQLVMIPIGQLHPHPDNPRKDLGDLSELTESIRKQGVMQNLTVVPGHWLTDEEWKELADKYNKKPDEDIRRQMNSKKRPDGYTVVIGHRRMAAAQAAGLAELPCVIRDLDNRKQFEIMMEENMQRQDLTIPEQAYGFQLMFNWGYSVKDIAEKTGFSETTVNHRLQIAKLDKRILKKRQQDSEDGTHLQLSISDLYELEKVQDIEKRNEILQNARNSQNLRYLVRTEIEEENRKKNKEIYIRMLEEIGIRKGTDQEVKNRYSNKYEYVTDIKLDEKPGKSLNIKLKKGLEHWYKEPQYNSERYIDIYRERPKNIQPSAEEIKRDENEADRKKLMKIKQSVDRDRKEFIRGIINGEYEGPKKTDAVLEAMEQLVEIAAGLYVKMDNQIIGEWIAGKQRFRWTDEDKEKVDLTGANLTALEKLLILIDYRADEVELMKYELIYGAWTDPKALNAFHEVLELWGFSVTDPEQIKVLDGTHELYRKKKEKQ